MYKKWAKIIVTLQRTQKRGLGSIQDCQSYLDFCKQNQLSLNSNVFNGTFYELYCKTILESSLYCNMMMRVGGSYDNGIDLLGKWDLSRFYHYSIKHFPSRDTPRVPAKALIRQSKEYSSESGGLYSLENDISILAQCKNVSKNINAQLIREMAGIYSYHVKHKTGTSSMRNNIMFLMTSTGLTKQALAQLDSTQLPIIHFKIPPLRYKMFGADEKDRSPDSVYQLANWEGEGLQSIYMNSNTQTLLSGLNMGPQLQLVIKQKHILDEN